MPNENVLRLLSRRLAGEATAEEEQQLDKLLQENPGDQYFAELLSAYWSSRPGPASLDTTLSPDQHFAHILDLAGDEAAPAATSSARIRRLAWIKRISAAAAITGIIGLGAWWFTIAGKTPSATTMQQSEVMARKGAKTKLVLPDGTSVWLNSDSRLAYDTRFNDSVREVTLEGEAYFDVTRNPRRPFIVHTSGIDVRVLGTAFNVKSYPQERTIEATLIHGSIEVLNKQAPKSPKVILRPHEKLVYSKDQLAFVVPGKPAHTEVADNPPAIAITSLPKNIPDTALKETSWVYNKLLFDGDTFRELAVKMERWFNVQIRFTNEKVANYRLRGAFENESVEEALQALQFIVSFTYKINGNEIEISKK